jgi:predicted O-methyltransferase YrrM
VLEIGVYRGVSIRAWHQFFENALIVGVDAAPQPDCEIPSTRAILVKANAADPAAVTQLAATHGPFDLIVDDGSHEPAEQRASLDLLLPHLRAEGIYVIEDVRTIDVARSLAAAHRGVIIDLRCVNGMVDDILVVFKGLSTGIDRPVAEEKAMTRPVTVEEIAKPATKPKTKKRS